MSNMTTLRLNGKVLQAAAIEMAHRLQWRVVHFAAAQVRPGTFITHFTADGKGFPDLLMVRDCVKAIEVKGRGDKIRPDQEAWLLDLEKAGVACLVLTPTNYRQGVLESFLA